MEALAIVAAWCIVARQVTLAGAGYWHDAAFMFLLHVGARVALPDGMLKRLAFTLSVAAVLAASGIRATGQAPQASTRDVIVVFYDDERDVDGLAVQHGHAYGAEISARYHSALKGYAAKVPHARIDDVRRDPRVAFVSDDREVEAYAQTLPTGVDRIDGELSKHYSSNSWGIAVAVIDTGSGPHADLNIAGGVNCQTGKSFSDGNGHGTHVAGTIGAINNGSGVVGVAPGIPIYSVRVLDSRGSGRFSNIICGIDWVTANASRLNIKVANMSLGGAGTDDGNCGNTNGDALHKAICSSVWPALPTWLRRATTAPTWLDRSPPTTKSFR